MVGRSNAGSAVSLTPRRCCQRTLSGANAMDLGQVFIFTVGWIFFAAWGMVLAAVSVIAFGRDFIPSAQRAAIEKERD